MGVDIIEVGDIFDCGELEVLLLSGESPLRLIPTPAASLVSTKAGGDESEVKDCCTTAAANANEW